MAQGQGIAQEIKQGQRLTKQQIMFGRLVEMNGTEISEEVQRELVENPALERKTDDGDGADNDLNKTQDGETYTESSDDMQRNDYYDEDNERPAYLNTNRGGGGNDDYTGPMAIAEQSIDEYLMEQVREKDLTERQYNIAQYIIGNIDDNGYLKRSSRDIADDLTFNAGVEVETHEVDEVLAVVRTLDPPGIAATDLQDCLLLQLRREPKTELNELVTKVVASHFNDYIHNRHDQICSALGITPEQMQQVRDEIRQLNPKPGSGFSGSVSESQNQQITPDFVITIDYDDNGEEVLTLTLENNIPELTISESYTNSYDSLKPLYEGKQLGPREKDEFVYIRDKYQNASAFIELLRRRQETLFRTMRSIMNRQRDYFVSGDEARLRPMVLRDVAADTGYDVSVISRARINKYVLTPYGTLPLKFFFSEEVNGSSSREVKSVLREIIDGENKRKPYSDDALCEMLKKRGYDIQRRTVAKYRDQLGLPVARMRKQL